MDDKRVIVENKNKDLAVVPIRLGAKKPKFNNNPKAKKPRKTKVPENKVVIHDFIKAPEKNHEMVLFGIPTTGQIRFEWHASFGQLVIPTNWSHAAHVVVSPLGYKVAEARNECVQVALEKGMDWLFFIDHDTLLPHDVCTKLRHYMLTRESPVISGLYYCKSSSPEPLIYRGFGNGPYYGFEHGDKVWVNGVPMGCTLIHMSLFRHMKPPWFDTPRGIDVDDKTGCFIKTGGTEDLYWCERVMSEGILAKAGWPELEGVDYPFILDTSIFCQHIDLASGKQYPLHCGEQWLQNHEIYYNNYIKKHGKDCHKQNEDNKNGNRRARNR